MSGEGKGLLFLIALIVIWGGNYTWVKLALADVGPLTFNAARYAGAAGLMIVAFALGGRLERLLPARGERLPLAFIGLLQVGVTTGCTALALRHIEATRVVLIIYSMPIWSLVVGAALFGERPTPRTSFGVALGAAGLAVLTNPLAMAWTGAALPGVLLALVAVFAWALGAVLYRARGWASDLWSQIFWQIAVSVLVLAPIAAAYESSLAINITPSLLANLLYNAIVPSVIGYWCWSQALGRVSVAHASQLLLLSPIYGIVQNHLVLGEPITASTYAACALILAGASLSLRRAERAT